jgi:hypothetical protein
MAHGKRCLARRRALLLSGRFRPLTGWDDPGKHGAFAGAGDDIVAFGEDEPLYTPQTLALGLGCLGLNLALSLAAFSGQATFWVMLATTLAFLVMECARSRTEGRCCVMASWAWIIFCGPAGLAMILAETLDQWAAVLSYICILLFGSLYFGAWIGKTTFWLLHRRRR